MGMQDPTCLIELASVLGLAIRSRDSERRQAKIEHSRNDDVIGTDRFGLTGRGAWVKSTTAVGG